jgi:nitrogen fixation NifU-like protein
MDLYRDIILDHYNNPLNSGSLDSCTISIDERNATCGDSVHVELLCSKTNSHLVDVKYRMTGCAISVAAASLVSEELKNMALDDILGLSTEYVTDLLGTTLTPTRVKCALLFLSAVKKAILTLEQH